MVSTPSRVAVLGFGVTGRSVVRHFLALGAQVTVVDTRAAQSVPSELARATFHWRSEGWSGLDVDVAILSPGLAMDSCLVRSTLAAGVPVLSDIDVFFEQAAAPVVGITGTNGKSTVTSLVGHLLESAGYKVGVGGNLGEPALDLLDPANEYYVLELSSFQLERSRHARLSRATVLNLSEDHIDQHGSFSAYQAAKRRIYQRAEFCIYNRADLATRPLSVSDSASFGLSEPVDSSEWGLTRREGVSWICRGEALVCRTDAQPLVGTHNLMNIMAACALVDGLVDLALIREALRRFKGLPHRYERVAEIAGVTYIDDSKATNLGATLAALDGLDQGQRFVLIAGGDAKGADLEPLAGPLAAGARAVIALGQDGPAVQDIAGKAGVENHAVSSLAEAVQIAADLAHEGDLVLLSPACASIDMFSDYMQRGRLFQKAVRDLPGCAL